MKRTTIAILGVSLVLLLAFVGTAFAGTLGSSAIPWRVFSGGGAPAAAGGVALNGSLGQPVAGYASSASYGMGSGYWHVTGREHRLYLPLVLAGFSMAPDLEVESLIATSSAVTVTLRNAGNAAVTQGFWVDLYIDPEEVPTINTPWTAIAPAGAVWGVTASLAPGERLVLVNNVSDPYYFSEYSSALPLPVGAEVYVLLDSYDAEGSYGAVWELNEGNNLGGPVLSTAGGPVDALTSLGVPPSEEGLPQR